VPVPSVARRLAATVALLLLLAGCGSSERADWPYPNLDRSSTRWLPQSGIDRGNVAALAPAWHFRFRIPVNESGVFTATPVVADGVVYVQDMKSNVFALDLETGKVRWRRLFDATNEGPNGVTVVGDRVYGATDTSAFALDATSGTVLWRRFLVTDAERYVNIAPQVDGGLVFVATVSRPPNGRGALYGLEQETGRVRWRFDTIKGRWRHPQEASGGGAWYTPAVEGGRVYWGIANPLPWGGSRAHPNGEAYAGSALYTDSLVVTGGESGKLFWYDQVHRHDVRDHDFQLPPILGSIGDRPVVFGAGKGGIVIAWDRETHERIWQARVGIHRNDTGPLPARMVSVCPGLLGGVLTPMASAEGKLFVPIVDLCMQGSAYGYEPFEDLDVPGRARGEIVALDADTGRRLWLRRFPQGVFGCATAADGVVFTSTFDGTVYALDTATGVTLWTTRASARINACPALADRTLLVGAGVPRAGGVLELTAYRLR
jgi:outer membrane protein assembly factor BamB